MQVSRKILIFHMGALGDFVLTWPLALALARLHPQSRIIYVTHGQKGALAEKALRLESVDIEAGWHHLFGDAQKLPDPARKLLSSAQSIYSYIASPGDVWAANTAKLAPQADLCFLCLDPKHPEIHATEHLISQLSTRPALAEATRQMLKVISTRGLGRANSTGPLVIHPGSGAREKCWPADRFLQLARELKSRGEQVRIILGEVELDRWPKEQITRFEELAEVRTPTSYTQLMDELSAASIYLGNDSGPSHLAGMLGVPSLILFGPTNPAVWRPLGPGVRVHHRNPLDQLSVEEVLADLAQMRGRG